MLVANATMSLSKSVVAELQAKLDLYEKWLLPCITPQSAIERINDIIDDDFVDLLKLHMKNATFVQKIRDAPELIERAIDKASGQCLSVLLYDQTIYSDRGKLLLYVINTNRSFGMSKVMAFSKDAAQLNRILPIHEVIKHPRSMSLLIILLLSKKIDKFALDQSKHTILDAALIEDSDVYFSEILSHVPDIIKLNPFKLVIERDDVKFARILLGHSAIDVSLIPVLNIAMNKNADKLFDLFLDHPNVNVNTQLNNLTVIELAAKTSAKYLKKILDSAKSKDIVCTVDNCPIRAAVSAGNKDTLILLLSHFHSTYWYWASECDLYKIYDIAVKNCNLSIVKMLLESSLTTLCNTGYYLINKAYSMFISSDDVNKSTKLIDLQFETSNNQKISSYIGRTVALIAIDSCIACRFSIEKTVLVELKNVLEKTKAADYILVLNTGIGEVENEYKVIHPKKYLDVNMNVLKKNILYMKKADIRATLKICRDTIHQVKESLPDAKMNEINDVAQLKILRHYTSILESSDIIVRPLMITKDIELTKRCLNNFIPVLDPMSIGSAV